MNYIFWIKIYNTIYVFWSYSNQKVTRSVCIHGTTRKRGFESHFLHFVFIEVYLIRHCYDRIYEYNVSFMCPERLCIFYKVIFIIYLPIKVPVLQWFRTRDHSGSSARRGLTDCATTELSKTRYWLSIYERSHSSEIELILKYFSWVPVWIWIN